MTAEIFETITSINPDQWNQLTEGHPFANWQWLQADETLSGDSKLRYVILSHQGKMQAGAVCSVQNRFHSRLLQSTLAWLPRRFPYLRCDMPFSLSSGLFFAEPPQLDKQFPELLEAIKTLAQIEHALFYSFDHLLAADPVWPYLQDWNFHRIEHISEAYLDICWPSQETYLESLAIQERQEYLHIQEFLGQQNISIETADPAREDLEALQRLTRDFTLHNQKPHHYRKDLFSTASTLLGKNFKLIIARQDHRVIGCLVLLHDAYEWLIRWPGLDIEHELSSEIYAAMLAASIQQVIIAKGHRLYLGVFAHQTLQNLGAIFEKRFGATAVRNRPLHWLAGRLLKITANPDAA
jgi:predicted N-acyltransferase